MYKEFYFYRIQHQSRCNMKKIDINKLNIVPTEQLIEERISNDSSFKVTSDKSIWILKDNVRAVDLYCYFNVRFGSPNGLLTTMKNENSSDNLFHWDYAFDYEGHKLMIICKTYCIEIIKSIEFEDQHFAKQQFINDVKSDFKNYGKELSIFKKQLQQWIVFVNPFKRLKNVIESQLELLESLKISEIPRHELLNPTTLATEKSIDDFTNSLKEAAKKYVEASSLGLSLRMLIPVYTESFVNFLIFMLGNKEVKASRQGYENAIHQPINVRVQNLHTLCVGFDIPVDWNNQLICKKFHSLMNKRNELLHGNINPFSNMFDTVYFDGYTPLFNEFRDISYDTHEASIKGVEFDIVLDDYQVAQDFISYLLLCLRDDIRGHVKVMMDKSYPGWDDKRKCLGVLFPEHSVNSIMIYSENTELI